jgi:hypothetical protein
MRRIACVLVVLLGVTGCQHSTVDTKRARVVSVKNEMPSDVPIVIFSVRDKRSDRGRVGVAKNGYNQVLHDLNATGDVTSWIRESIVESLENAGAQVFDDMVPGAVVMNLSLVELFTEANANAFSGEITGKIVLDAEVEFPDGRAFTRRFGGVAKETYYMDWGFNLYERHIHKATDIAIRRLVSALRALIINPRAAR